MFTPPGATNWLLVSAVSADPMVAPNPRPTTRSTNFPTSARGGREGSEVGTWARDFFRVEAGGSKVIVVIQVRKCSWGKTPKLVRLSMSRRSHIRARQLSHGTSIAAGT
ncbi:MAG: hypothetical protein ACYDEP_01000 [Acidimicrobiales bacterium]